MQVVGANGVKYLLKAIVDRLGWSGHVRRVLNAPGDVLLGPVYAYKARNLEGILLIAGYNQSGSTLIGALLNAHPDAVVVPKAKSLLYARLPGNTKGVLVSRIVRRERRIYRESDFYRKVRSVDGYNYRVETGWQGRYARLRLVGDKCADLYTHMLHEDPALLDLLRRRLDCPLRVLFSYRNPYDMVAAWSLRAPDGGGVSRVPLRNLRFSEADRPDLAQRFIDRLRRLSRQAAEVLARLEDAEVLPVRHERFVVSPKDSLRDVLTFLGLDVSDAYLDACAALVKAPAHRTRFKVRWTSAQIAEVDDVVRTCPWFDGYTFDA